MIARAAYRAIAGGLVVLALGGAGACVLADPPAELPVPPLQPVVIIRVEVQPPITAFLDTWPGEFDIPVSAEPNALLQARFFIDGLLVDAPQSSATIPIPLTPPPPATEECHTLLVIVSYPGSSQPGDSVSWFYSPTRSFTDCPVFDAGPGDAGGDVDAGGSGG